MKLDLKTCENVKKDALGWLILLKMMTKIEEEGVTIKENNLKPGSIKTTRLINISNIVKDIAPTYIVTNILKIFTI